MLKLTIRSLIAWTYTRALDLTSVQDASSLDAKLSLADGSGLNQASVLLTDRRTLAGAAAENLNLQTWNGGTDSLGQAVNLTKVKALLVRNKSVAADAVLEVGGEGSSNAWVSPFEDAFATVKVGPGGILLLANPSAAGFAVGGTNKLLRIANSGAAAVDYEIVIAGA